MNTKPVAKVVPKSSKQLTDELPKLTDKFKALVIKTIKEIPTVTLATGTSGTVDVDAAWSLRTLSYICGGEASSPVFDPKVTLQALLDLSKAEGWKHVAPVLNEVYGTYKEYFDAFKGDKEVVKKVLYAVNQGIQAGLS